MDATDFFIGLKEKAERDSAVVAVLRRSAAYPPGQYPPAFPYVEPSLGGLSEWRRSATYLAVSCWALAARRKQGGQCEPLTLPRAVHDLKVRSINTSKNIEVRFTTLLDSDEDELQWRLRHLTSQLASAAIAVDWPELLEDIWRWTREDRMVQTKWARQFWSPSSTESSRGADAQLPA
jgi:CRISPR system Cascade subunit CasB